MNFLAHLYLSGESKELRLGNFIADYVKGKQYLNYPDKIQEGILLHRKIDDFTDHHSAVIESAKFLKKGYARYSGVVIDLFFDHFLAKNWNEFHMNSLSTFVNKSHEIFIKNYLLLPTKVKLFLPFLIQSRRLEAYANFEGLQRALDIMANRTSLPDKSQFAIECLKENYPILEENFFLFMKDIIAYISTLDINVTIPDDSHLNAGK
jgi:acyl carrier protein phosphodiesterase